MCIKRIPQKHISYLLPALHNQGQFHKQHINYFYRLAFTVQSDYFLQFTHFNMVGWQ